MKKTLLLLITFSTIYSCSIFKSTQNVSEKNISETEVNDEITANNINQKFLGNYSIEIKGIPSVTMVH